MEKNINHSKVFMYVFYLLLSINGGFFEVYSLYKHSFFAFMQTGNIVNIVSSLIQTNFNSLIISLISFLSFIIGFIINVLIKYLLNKNNKDSFLFHLIILIILNILLIVIPTSYDFNIFKILEVIILTIYGVVLVSSFNNFNFINFTPTMMTNNTRRTIEFGIEGLLYKDNTKISKFKTYLLIVIFFILGVTISVSLLHYVKIDNLVINESLTYNPNIFSVIPLINLILCLIIYLKNKSSINL